jgi:O-antigen ligase
MLLFWLTVCVTDVNHPPGIRTVRLLAAAALLGLGLLEYVKPFWGLGLFLLLWPHLEAVRELLTENVSPLFAGLPILWGGATAAVLALAFFAREKRQATGCRLDATEGSDAETRGRGDAERTAPLPSKEGLGLAHHSPLIGKYLLSARAALWLLTIVYGLSAAVCVARLQSPPPGWVVIPGDWRHLLNAAPLTNVMPFLGVLEIVPALMLGIIVLDRLNTKEASERVPVRGFLLAGAVTAILAALQYLSQWKWGWRWSFGLDGAAGPFRNRNTLAPFLVLFGAALLFLPRRSPANNAAAPTRKNLWGRVVRWTVGAMLLIAACTTGSRNSLVAVLSLVMLASLYRAGKIRLILAISGTILVVGILLTVPLPASNSTRFEAFRRLNNGVASVRTGSPEVRKGLYQAAWSIFTEHPVLGSGPETFPMQATPGGRYGDLVREVGVNAHSMPLNLLAETGILGALAWLALWFVIPITALIRWRAGNGLALLVALVGMLNLFDTFWLVPGMPATSVLLIACALAANGSETSSGQ